MLFRVVLFSFVAPNADSFFPCIRKWHHLSVCLFNRGSPLSRVCSAVFARSSTRLPSAIHSLFRPSQRRGILHYELCCPAANRCTCLSRVVVAANGPSQRTYSLTLWCCPFHRRGCPALAQLAFVSLVRKLQACRCCRQTPYIYRILYSRSIDKLSLSEHSNALSDGLSGKAEITVT